MSEKTVVQKLLIKAGYRVLIVDPPSGYLSALGKLPDKVTLLDQKAANADLVQLFAGSRKELEAKLPGVRTSMKPNGLLWVTYPKGTSKTKADINRGSINAYAQSIGLQGVAMVSVDDTWSALRLKAMS